MVLSEIALGLMPIMEMGSFLAENRLCGRARSPGFANFKYPNSVFRGMAGGNPAVRFGPLKRRLAGGDGCDS